MSMKGRRIERIVISWSVSKNVETDGSQDATEKGDTNEKKSDNRKIKRRIGIPHQRAKQAAEVKKPATKNVQYQRSSMIF